MVRKRPKRTSGSRAKPREVKRSDGNLKRWENISDIPLDEEDQFHTSRDKILLDGDNFVGHEDGDEDEVFRLKGMSDEDDDEEEEAEDMAIQDFGHAVEPLAKKKNTSKSKGKKSISQSSSSEGGSESEEETWGRSKSAYYSSNAADLESDEEANELEEQEAKRLQRRARDAMTDVDFGLEDPVEVGQGHSEEVVAYSHPTEVISDKKSSLRHLEKNSPETLALSRDWEDTACGLIRCRNKIDRLGGKEPDTLSLGMIHLHYQTLLTYATTLAFYLHLRSSEKYIQRPELLQTHPIFSRLLCLKQSLTTLEDLDFTISDSEEDDDTEEDEGDVLIDAQQLWKHDRKKGLDPDELDDLLKDAALPSEQAKHDPQPAKEERPKKKRKTTPATTNPHLLPEFDLREPVFTPSKSSLPRARLDSELVDAFGEPTSLHYADAADKNARKRSLRFHTSRIGSASLRRQGARSKAIGGDDDLPYKERRREKEARLVEEAKMSIRGQGGDDLDDVDPETLGTDRNSRTVADGAVGDEEEGTDGYYELVKQKAKEKREQKKTEYEAAKSVQRTPDLGCENISGPRSLTRAMLTNKGLTPRRPKSVRNPRVKKRQKFEKAKRKVSSQKAVYKGGIGDTGKYGGEKTGISKVVKSVRLG